MIQNLEALTLLAYQDAPFFFAVLFAIFITQRAYHAYSTARTLPSFYPTSPSLQKGGKDVAPAPHPGPLLRSGERESTA